MPTGGWRCVWHLAVPELRELAEALAATGDPADRHEANELRLFAERRQAARDTRAALAMERIERFDPPFRHDAGEIRNGRPPKAPRL